MPASIYLLLPIAFWAGNYILGRLTVSNGIDPYTISFLRWSLACLIMLPFAYKKLWLERKIIAKNWPILILFGWLGICNYNLFLYIGLTSTTVTNAVLLNSIMPVIILITARFLLGNKTSWLQNMGIFISTVGAITIVSRGSLDTFLHLTISQGDLWIIAAAISWAIYSVMIVRRPKEMSLIGFFTSTAIIGTLFQMPLFFIFGETQLTDLTTGNWGTILYMALFASIGAFLCWNTGIQKLGAATAGQFIHLLPVFSITLSVIFLGENLLRFHYIGILLIFSGIFVATMLNNKQEQHKKRKQMI
ncbi:DMT family transporter [Marinomonas colpomeniae]|uniref:EamA family transporter n=1 Tax=Marinomonas colpomeniae TaxID=2774408 RepID=A0ABR8NUU0_9GAMM|nr:DMT family transporter [Marinomonas colpomeniae]MBD5769806.1 EamA family transporter [Marinomonas colpomeniae]